MRWGVRIALVMMGACPAAGGAQPDFEARGLCAALHGVAAEARESKADRHVTIRAGRDVIWEFACQSEKSRAEGRFCDAVFKAVGLEFKHTFPWFVDTCLRRANIVPTEEITRAYVGFDGPGRIDHLAADTGRAHIDIRYVPESEPTLPEDRRDYYGRYEMVVSPR